MPVRGRHDFPWAPCDWCDWYDWYDWCGSELVVDAGIGNGGVTGGARPAYRNPPAY